MSRRDLLRIHLQEVDELEAHVDGWQQHVTYALDLQRTYIDRLDISPAYTLDHPARLLGTVAVGVGSDLSMGEVARRLDAGRYPAGIAHSLRAAIARYLLEKNLVLD